MPRQAGWSFVRLTPEEVRKAGSIGAEKDLGILCWAS